MALKINSENVKKILSFLGNIIWKKKRSRLAEAFFNTYGWIRTKSSNALTYSFTDTVQQINV